MKTKNIIIIILLIIIITLLIGITPPNSLTPSWYIDKAKHDLTREKIGPVEMAIDAYKNNTGKLPVKLEDLLICPNGLEESWAGPYSKESQLYDPWDNPFIYKIDTTDPNNYRLISYGADGKPGGDGYDKDIYNN